jgi:glyoxylase-like metal-dependent hydrolase (beta-lactamase superfamily II)
MSPTDLPSTTEYIRAIDSPPGHPEIVRIVAPNPGPMTLEGTNTYVVGSQPAYVIDPGPADERHLDAVRTAAEDRGGIAGVLLTHSHADHSAAVPMLGAPLLFGDVGAGDETSGESGAAAGSAGFAITVEPRRVGPFEVLPTPGHAVDHVCFLLGRVGLCGDLVLGRGSTFVPPDGGSLGAYLNSLERLRAADLELLCPGHGPYIEDPRNKIDEYLEHRLMRERRLTAALQRGERSRARLLDLVWDDVPEALRPAAAVVMEAHLEKLQADGRLPRNISD